MKRIKLFCFAAASIIASIVFTACEPFEPTDIEGNWNLFEEHVGVYDDFGELDGPTERYIDYAPIKTNIAFKYAEGTSYDYNGNNFAKSESGALKDVLESGKCTCDGTNIVIGNKTYEIVSLKQGTMTWEFEEPRGGNKVYRVTMYFRR